MRYSLTHLITVLLLIATMVCSLAIMSNAATDPIVLDAEDIDIDIPDIMNDLYGMTQSYDITTGVKTITASKSAQITDGHRFYVKFADAGVKIREYPYIAVGVVANNTVNNKLDWDTTTDPGGRMWGRKFTVPNDGNISKVVIDGLGYTGGERGGFNNALRDNAVYKQFEIRPGVQGETTNVGETISFQYVAFFATQAEAEAFEYTYTAPTNRVIFYADEEGTEEFCSYYIKQAGETIVLPDEEPTADNQQFIRWRNAPGYPSIPVTEDTIIEDMTTDFKVYPEFYDIFTVRFMTDEDTVFEEQTYLEGADLVLPEETPVADGYVFKGWICDREGKEVWANADYYADWTVTHKVRFYLDKNSDLYCCMEVEDNCSLEELPPDPCPPEGYKFVGWIDIDSDEIIDTDTIVTRPMSLYPYYEKDIIGETQPIIKLTETVAYIGKQVKIDVTIKNNPGIAFMRLFLDYDSDILTLAGVEDKGLLGNSVHTDSLDSLPYVLFWNNPTIKENITENGTAVTLIFDVSEDAPIGKETIISLSYDNENDDIIDVDFNPVEFELDDGIITIKDPLYGDVNDDGKVTAIDGAYIARYLANWQGYEADKLDLVMSDVNLNGEVDAMDSVIISRHLARWTGYLTLPIEIE